MLSEREIIARFDRGGLVEEERVYLRGQARRYEFLLGLIDELRAELGFPSDGRGLRILDVGPSFQTQLLREQYPDAVVDTLGLEPSAVSTARRGERHFDYDLNDVLDPERSLRVEPYPLVLLAEVIEHLYTPPVPVFRKAAQWLEPRGLIVVQTPNAATLFKRLRLLVGRNPYHELRESRRNPGHFREYTLAELLRYAEEADLSVVRSTRQNYFGGEGFRARFYRLTRCVLPAGMRSGITLVLRRGTSPG